jgi:phthiocerol/phenolphthiocerol synthesis type-I polyketide synthase E
MRQVFMNETDVAVIGMAGRFPGASNINQFWLNLQNGIESGTDLTTAELDASGVPPEVYSNPRYVRRAAILSDIDLFDASFFGYSPTEAAIIDPQQRFFLECAWEALENAGYNVEGYDGSIGVYAGMGMSSYLLNNLYHNITDMSDFLPLMFANMSDTLSTRVSYKLNLRGPSISVQSGCSTSLVAVHVAVQALLSGECTMALAGGVSINVPQKIGYLYADGSPSSPDGYCRAFDADAKGVHMGSAVGIVVLKRYVDAIAEGDNVLAIIKGSAVNNDGARKIGYMAPSVEGQAAVIAEALAIANVSADSISYVEAHGTGTELGDPVEVKALTKAFRLQTEAKGYCGLGSVKTNIGHLDTAAGIAGFIKTVLALQHKKIPPSLNFKTPNPRIDFPNTPFYVNTVLKPWLSKDGMPLRAGISALGIGGTNAHVILEESPAFKFDKKDDGWYLFPLSARTTTALEQATNNIKQYLENNPDINLSDVVYTLSVGRKTFKYRRVLVCQNVKETIAAIENQDQRYVTTEVASDEDRSIVFMFPGQGAVYKNIAKEFYDKVPVFREALSACAEIVSVYLGLDLRKIFYDEEIAGDKYFNDLTIMQVGFFSLEYALAKTWLDWGIEPTAMVGFSLGEYVVATLSEVITLEEALKLVILRAMLSKKLPAGANIIVKTAVAKIRPYLQGSLSIAAVSLPTVCIISGLPDDIDNFKLQLEQKGIVYVVLPIPYAAHSSLMDPILSEFRDQVKQIEFKPPKMPYVSCVTGNWAREEVVDPEHWVAHLRNTVQFSEAMTKVLSQKNSIFLEVSPEVILGPIVKKHPLLKESHVLLSSLHESAKNKSAVQMMLTTFGKLWAYGTTVNWNNLYRGEKRLRIPLPSYPFERVRYWAEPPHKNNCNTKQSFIISTNEENFRKESKQKKFFCPRDSVEQQIATTWEDNLGVKQIGIYDDYFIGLRILSQLRSVFNIVLTTKDLLENPTIDNLAQIIRQQQQSSAAIVAKTACNIIKINLGDEKTPPLFCVHPAGGGVFWFVNLAKHLAKNQPIYAFESPIFLGLKEYDFFNERAIGYAKEIKKMFPHGPYRICGFSFGGNLAHQIAVTMQKDGDEIEFLGLFDSFPSLTYQDMNINNRAFLDWFLRICYKIKTYSR